MALALPPFPGPYGGSDIYTKLLLHLDGANNALTWADSSNNRRALGGLRGDAKLSTAQAKFGGSSLVCDGTGDSAYYSDSADWYFATGDFTVDFWVRLAAGTTHGFWGQAVDGNNRASFGMDGGALSAIGVFGGTVAFNYTVASGTHGMTTGVWYHVAYVRNGSAFYIFKDGTSLALTTGTAIGTNNYPDISDTIDLGRAFFNGQFNSLNGWIDEFRLSKGVARWTANFTPPNCPYT